MAQLEAINFIVAGHFASALINDDRTGLVESDCRMLNRFLASNIGRLRGHWSGFDEELDSRGFTRCDITGLYAECYNARYWTRSKD